MIEIFAQLVLNYAIKVTTSHMNVLKEHDVIVGRKCIVNAMPWSAMVRKLPSSCKCLAPAIAPLKDNIDPSTNLPKECLMKHTSYQQDENMAFGYSMCFD